MYTIWSSPQLSVPTRCCADQVNSEPHTGIEDIGHSDDQVNIESFTPMQLYFSDFLFLDLVLPSFLSPPDAALTKLAARTSDTLMTKLTSSFTPMQLYFCSLKYDSCAPSCLRLVLSQDFLVLDLSDDSTATWNITFHFVIDQRRKGLLLPAVQLGLRRLGLPRFFLLPPSLRLFDPDLHPFLAPKDLKHQISFNTIGRPSLRANQTKILIDVNRSPLLPRKLIALALKWCISWLFSSKDRDLNWRRSPGNQFPTFTIEIRELGRRTSSSIYSFDFWRISTWNISFWKAQARDSKLFRLAWRLSKWILAWLPRKVQSSPWPRSFTTRLRLGLLCGPIQRKFT